MNGILLCLRKTEYIYDDNNRLTTQIKRIAAGRAEQTTYSYDNNGNLITELKGEKQSATEMQPIIEIGVVGETASGVNIYEYDNRNRLKHVYGDTPEVEYTYDADGLRKSKTVNGETVGYVWNGMNMIAQTDESGIQELYTYDITGIAMKKEGAAVQYYLKNTYGDVIGIGNSDGTIAESFNYDAFGNMLLPPETAGSAATAVLPIEGFSQADTSDNIFMPWEKAQIEEAIPSVAEEETGILLPEATEPPQAPNSMEMSAIPASSELTEYVEAEEGKVYLSDMAWKSATNGWGPVERDMSNKEQPANDGDTLTINGVGYEKGIGCHAVSEIEIEINKNYTEFEVTVGIDDYAPSYVGKVKFKIYGDDELLYETDYLTGADDGEEIEVDVSDVEVLKLVADNDGVNVNYNYADWADAKLTPKETIGYEGFGYRGEYSDGETGLIYLRNRYYAPNAGRFITEDPIRDGMNWYVYANNNPIMFMDPWGLDYIKLRETVELLEGEVKWDDATKTAKVVIGNKRANFVYNPYASYEGNTDPTIVNDIMYVQENEFYGKIGVIGYETSQGKVIIVYDNNKKFNIGNDDYIVQDHRKEYDPNMKIENSYKANSKSKREEVINVLMHFESVIPSVWNRTKKSMENEWFWHNCAYDFNYERERTKDVDLNNADENKYSKLIPF